MQITVFKFLVKLQYWYSIQGRLSSLMHIWSYSGDDEPQHSMVKIIIGSPTISSLIWFSTENCCMCDLFICLICMLTVPCVIGIFL